ncbi:CCR4-NOT transcription complex subunit 10, partial [Halocaridina rubra]
MAENKSIAEDSPNPPAIGESNNSCDATDTERDLAQAALAEFNKSNYQTTLTLLNQLQESRPKDPKVLMNKAVAEYYRSDLKKTDAFRKQLVEICSQAGFKIDEVSLSGEVDQSVIHLNNCVILYHLHQYRTALALLEKMYVGLESLEESVGIGVCLLMAECYLGAYQPEKVLTVISHTETTFLPQPLPHTPSPKQAPSQEKENKSPEKIYVPFGSGSNGGSSSSSSSSSIGSSSVPPPPPPPDEIRCSATQEQLRAKLQQLRVRALLMMRALRVAKKELKTVVTHAVSSGKSLNITLVSLKSQLEYLRGNYRKAIKVLNQCAAVPSPSS